MKHQCLAAAVAIALTAASTSSFAFKLRPEGTEQDRSLARLDPSGLNRLLYELTNEGIKFIGDPIHEEITHRAFGCQGGEGPRLLDCGKRLKNPLAPAAVIEGVRWNDNPPFVLSKQPDEGPLRQECLGQTLRIPRLTLKCWLPIFQAAESKPNRAYTGKAQSPLVQRSHFGDLQFLHSMSTTSHELAGETRGNIMAWGRFTYGVYRGEYTADHFLTRCPQGAPATCRTVGLPHISKWFPGEMTVSNLFTQGDTTYRQNVRELALGSFLHLVQDSFSEAHVTRLTTRQDQACGRGSWRSYAVIAMFHNYAAQDAGKHAEKDGSLAFARGLLHFVPNVVNASQQVRQVFDTADWETVEDFLENCLFVLNDPEAQSGPGTGFD